MLRTEITKSHLNNHICQHRGMKTSTMTPSSYYVFNISFNCNDTIASFIGNLWRVLLLGNHLKYARSFYRCENSLIFFSLRPVLYYDYFILFSVCILPLVCSLQSAVCILPPVCILAPVCSLQSAFCTEWKFTEKELKVQATKEQVIIEGIKPSNTRPVSKIHLLERNGKFKIK